jgi:hypothetical protein
MKCEGCLQLGQRLVRSLQHQVWFSISRSVISAALRRIVHLSLSVVSRPACSLSGQVYGIPLGGRSGRTCVSFCFPLPFGSAHVRRAGSMVGGDGVR